MEKQTQELPEMSQTTTTEYYFDKEKSDKIDATFWLSLIGVALILIMLDIIGVVHIY